MPWQRMCQSQHQRCNCPQCCAVLCTCLADFDACGAVPAPCDGNATCTDKAPPALDAICECLPGFAGNGAPGNCTRKHKTVILQGTALPGAVDQSSLLITCDTNVFLRANSGPRVFSASAAELIASVDIICAPDSISTSFEISTSFKLSTQLLLQGSGAAAGVRRSFGRFER